MFCKPSRENSIENDGNGIRPGFWFGDTLVQEGRTAAWSDLLFKLFDFAKNFIFVSDDVCVHFLTPFRLENICSIYSVKWCGEGGESMGAVRKFFGMTKGEGFLSRNVQKPIRTKK